MERSTPWQVFTVFLGLGCRCFGGPVAHIGYFRDEFVARRGWMDERSYADLVALCQFLPGPASSQVGMGVGISRAGPWGALAAWVGFTAPSAVLMIAFAYGVVELGDTLGGGWLQGLKAMAVAVVAQAVWGMARSLCPDRPRQTLAVLATILVLLWPGAWGQIAAILGGAILGRLLLEGSTDTGEKRRLFPVSRGFGIAALVAFFAFLFGLPVLAAAVPVHGLAAFDSFYRAGSLVFGGGHVVLPLLQAEVVPPGWLDTDTFLAGYGAAQAVPGPLFTFSAYLGTAMSPGGGWAFGLLCLVAIFLPSFLLLYGALPFWDALRTQPAVQSALAGVNAAVVGLLIAVLFTPMWTTTIRGTEDFVLALTAFTALVTYRVSPWLVAILAALAGAALAAL